MKQRRLLKMALAALLILLPLILSGCYVAPTDLPANNSGGDSLNFPTYQPASTPIPTAAPTVDETVVPPVSTLGTAIPLPTANVNTWTISTIAPSTTDGQGGPAGITVTTVTPLPYTPVPTATPQGSLKLGSTGQDVRNVQQKLKSLGFLKGNVDGDFGAATEAAVRAFQKQYGLTVDGKVGAATLKKLASARATAKPAAGTATHKGATPKGATPRRTATPAYSSKTYLRKGSSGLQVRQMQERLISLGYLTGTASGKFDDSTEAGLMAFQRRNLHYADGVAGPETLKALYSSSARKTSTAAGIVGDSLRPGANGKAVRALQTRLKALGYYKGTVDGDYGVATQDAVKAFQRANGLTADGIAGSGTFAKMYSSSAKSASQAAHTATPKRTPTRRPTATPRRTPTPLPPNTYVQVTSAPDGQYATLRRGYTGAPVKSMQQELKKQGYYTGTVDGVYGEGTENAVKSFQRSNGLNVDGTAGPATLRVLFEGNFPFGS